MVYLCAMRNLKEYCKKGYCDFMLAACRFSDYPQSLALRMLRPYRNMAPFCFDWNNREEVYDFLLRFIRQITIVYHTRFNAHAFESAFEEFSQYLIARKR